MSVKELLASLAKNYGEGAAMFYGDFDKVDVQRISSGIPSLDRILGGGIPEGRILEIFGPASSGKSTLATKFLAEVQKAYPKKSVAYIDVEHAIDPAYAKALGLDMDKVILAQPNSAEDALGIMEELAASGEIKAIVLDSVAKLAPRKETEGDLGDSEMAMRARLMSKHFRRLTPHAHKNMCTCFYINQVRSSLSQYGNPEVRPGGQALPFDASIIIRIESKKDPEDKTGETGISKFKVIKNKVGKPFRETTVAIRYGTGFDIVQDLITVALDMGIITRAGAFYSFGAEKRQGEKAMRESLIANPSFQETLKVEIKSNRSKEPILAKKEK